ncbi:MAG: hypothetical protein HC783_04290 [Rhodobacteraceae bacterium]|nr:hypothetical protein [Paracoccaceae bacterium]
MDEEAKNVQAKAPPQWARVVLSYVAACAAAAFVVGVYSMIVALVRAGPMSAFHALIGTVFFGFIFTAIVALPSFILMRGLLYLLNRYDVWSFTVGGAVNAYGTAIAFFRPDSLELFLKYPPNPILAIAGAAGGLAAWWTEGFHAQESHRSGDDP